MRLGARRLHDHHADRAGAMMARAKGRRDSTSRISRLDVRDRGGKVSVDRGELLPVAEITVLIQPPRRDDKTLDGEGQRYDLVAAEPRCRDPPGPATHPWRAWPARRPCRDCPRR